MTKDEYKNKYGVSAYYSVIAIHVSLLSLIFSLVFVVAENVKTFDNVNNILLYSDTIWLAVPFPVVLYFLFHIFARSNLLNSKWEIPEFNLMNFCHSLAIFLLSFTLIIFINCNYDRGEATTEIVSLDYAKKKGCFKIIGEFASERISLCNR